MDGIGKELVIDTYINDESNGGRKHTVGLRKLKKYIYFLNSTDFLFFIIYKLLVQVY